ncbi:hypothetical protein [Streptomyces sp. NRRL S-455]|uniref:hypothetical protein n=1 Tax=Streptomyces sp. NRRL S-455 TaxID=1463908 RepID=UPI0004BEFEFA|nr:hypothetical protein [Streptomyces sp. NRRL S-455]
MNNATTTEDKWRAEGYAWGLFIPGPDWLTVPGSAHRSAPLTERPEDAERPNYAAVHGGEVSPWVLAKVQRCGGGTFRVLEVVREVTPERAGS